MPHSVDVAQQAGTTPAHVPAIGSAMRCTLRVSAKGLYVDGDPTSRSEAVAICKRRAAAMVVLDDGVASDEWRKVETALRREGIEILMRGPLGHSTCLDDPLAKGCP